MSIWFDIDLQSVEEIRGDSDECGKYKLDRPYSFLNGLGKPLYAFGQVNGCSYKTPFFIIKTIDYKKGFAVLNSVVPYPYLAEDIEDFSCIQTLLRTEDCIVVDLSCFSALTSFSFPVKDSILLTDNIKEHIHFSFKVSNKECSQTLWHTDEDRLNNIATITLKQTNGNDLIVNMTVYTNEEQMTVTVPKGKSRAITVTGLRKVDILTPEDWVKGTIDIQLNIFENTIISYI